MLRRFAVGDVLRRHSQRFPDKLAFVWVPKTGEPVEYTYKALNRLVNKLANGLSFHGIKRGDGIAVLSLNTYQIPLTMAVAKIGAYITPINPMLNTEAVTYILKQSEVKFLFVEDTFIDEIKTELSTFAGLTIGFIGISADKEIPPPWIDIKNMIEESPDQEPEVEIGGEDTLTLTYTSGTEAFPKGVVLTHLNWYAAIIGLQADSYKGIRESDVNLESLPMFYTGGMCVGLYPLLVGGTVVNTYVPDPSRMVEMMARYKVSYVILPPTLYLRLLKVPGIGVAARSLRRCLSFGATIPEGMIAGWNEVAPHVQWVSLYGSSEPTCFGTVGLYKTVGDIPEKNLGWVGIPSPCLEMKIVDDDDREVPQGQIGEIVLRGPVVMKEYFKNEEKTKETFAGGWFHSGDLGRLGERGDLFFVDRKKDMIKSGGENIPTAEIELAVGSHSKVSEVAAFGVYHPEWMEALVVAVTPIEGETLTEDEILQHCRHFLPKFKVPKYVLIVSDFPRNPTGKILKRELRVIYKDLALQRANRS
jgi:fatty-acyl-CoA synthase